MSKLKQGFDRIVADYVRTFEQKQGIELDFWIDKLTFTVGSFGDYYFSISDLITDIEEDAPSGLILNWQQLTIEEFERNVISGEPSTSYKNYIENYKSAILKV